MLDAVIGPANPGVVVTPSGDGLQYALLALAGVLLGALITSGFNFWVAWRKERADATSERRHHEVEVRRAARLIDDDLHTAADAARWCVEHKEWWFSGQQLTSMGWQQYRDVLAPELSEIAWPAVSLAVTTIDRLQSVRDQAARGHRAKMATDPDTADMVAAAIAHDLDVFDPAPVPDTTAAQIETLLWGLDNGRAVLATLMRDKP